MRIPVFAIEANPSIDPPFIRKSESYCEAEVSSGRALKLGTDIRAGIQVLPKDFVSSKVDARGSREQSGCLTARESELNSEHRHPETDVALLSQHYEFRLEQHILKGRKGTPRMCDVIAARVKTILSQPTVRVVS